MDDDQKKQGHRRAIDHGNTFSRMLLARSQIEPMDSRNVRPEPSYIIDMMPPPAYKNNPMSSIATKFAHTSINKLKHPILTVTWTPEGRRLLTGSMSGEFTLWNGMTFNFETIMQAHESAIRTMVYSHNGDWLLSGDNDGTIKYWQPNFNNVNIVEKAHREVIRELAFSPNDTRFATASDDGTLKIWNFQEARPESELKGHGWDVKCVDWHPTLGLLASGSKDNLVKLWDPRTSKCLTTLHGYKNTVTKSLFQKTGGQRLLASSSRDHTCRIFDIRMMREFLVLRGHDSDVSSLAWHPIHANLISSGTHDGTISHFLLDTVLPDNSTNLNPTHQIVNAHDWPIWSLQYHPLGHLLCSGSNDKMTRFWCRARPGDEPGLTDKYHQVEEKKDQGKHHSHNNNNNQQKQIQQQQQQPVQPPQPTIPTQLKQTDQQQTAIPGLSIA